jgi:hypothetical protein
MEIFCLRVYAISGKIPMHFMKHFSGKIPMHFMKHFSCKIPMHFMKHFFHGLRETTELSFGNFSTTANTVFP